MMFHVSLLSVGAQSFAIPSYAWNHWLCLDTPAKVGAHAHRSTPAPPLNKPPSHLPLSTGSCAVQAALLSCSICCASLGSQALRSAYHFPLLSSPSLGGSLLLPSCLTHVQHSGLVRPKWWSQGTSPSPPSGAKTSCRTLASTA